MNTEIYTSCQHCDGYGETPECSKCLHCDGTGETKEIVDVMAEIAFEPSEENVECESCGKTAIHRHYERVEGGCLNAYWEIACKHCGRSRTNDFFS